MNKKELEKKITATGCSDVRIGDGKLTAKLPLENGLAAHQAVIAIMQKTACSFTCRKLPQADGDEFIIVNYVPDDDCGIPDGKKINLSPENITKAAAVNNGPVISKTESI